MLNVRIFAVRMQLIFEQDENALVMSDEAHFHLNGTVNLNLRCWASENPRHIHQRPLRSQCVTVWYAVAPFGVIGPYLFEENGVAVTVTAAHYIDTLRNFFQPELRRGINMRNVWFQQDGATVHCKKNNEHSSDHVCWARYFPFR
jgi:hypothetical protein